MGGQSAATTALIGQTLFGKWTVERCIGVGGTSTVLAARHRNGRRAALKILHPHLAAHGRARERFLREGRLANLVGHPGVVAVLDDFVSDDGTAVLVLELVAGANLAARAKARGGRLGPEEVVNAGRAVLDVLVAAHDAGVIHRDIKPENILFCEGQGYRLADFGLAGLHDELGTLTASNASLGTPAYMSPEQARGDTRRIDARTDLWALAATMFTLLTGRFVHDAGSPRNLVVAAATEPALPTRALAPGIQPELADLLDRALAMDRDARWPDARAMLAALSAIDVEARPVSASADAPDATTVPTAPSSWIVSPPLPRSDARASRGRRLRWGLFSAVGASLLGAAALLARPAPDGEAAASDAGVPRSAESDRASPKAVPATRAESAAAPGSPALGATPTPASAEGAQVASPRASASASVPRRASRGAVAPARAPGKVSDTSGRAAEAFPPGAIDTRW